MALYSKNKTKARLTCENLYQDALSDYCIEKCAETNMMKSADPKIADPAGCKCDRVPGHTTLPTAVFLTPAIGLIFIGV